MKKIIASTFLVYLNLILKVIFGFVASIYLIRQFSQVQFGEYRQFLSFITISAYITSFGLENSLSRFIPELIHKKEYRNANKLYILLIGLRVVILFIFVLLFNIFNATLVRRFNLPAIFTSLALIISGVVFFNRLTSLYGSQLASAYFDFYKENLRGLLVNILQFTNIIIVLTFHLGVSGLIYISLIIEILSFLTFLLYAFNKYKKNKEYWKSIESYQNSPLILKRVFRFAFFSFLTVTSSMFLDTSIDVMVISKYYGSIEVALYSFAALLAGIPRMLNPLSVLRGLLNPILVKHYYQNNEKKDLLQFYFAFYAKIIMSLMFPLFIIIAFLNKQIISIVYKPEYLSTGMIIIIFCCAYGLSSLTYAASPIINILEKTEISFYSGLFPVLNIVLDFILIPKFGIFGAAIATGSCLILQFTFNIFLLYKLTKVKLTLSLKLLFRLFINLSLIVIFLLLTRNFIHSFFLLLFYLIIVGVLSIVLFYFNNIFNDKERNLIKVIYYRFSNKQ